MPRSWQKTPTCPAGLSSFPASKKSGCNSQGHLALF